MNELDPGKIMEDFARMGITIDICYAFIALLIATHFKEKEIDIALEALSNLYKTKPETSMNAHIVESVFEEFKEKIRLTREAKNAYDKWSKNKTAKTH